MSEISFSLLNQSVDTSLASLSSSDKEQRKGRCGCGFPVVEHYIIKGMQKRGKNYTGSVFNLSLQLSRHADDVQNDLLRTGKSRRG